MLKIDGWRGAVGQGRGRRVQDRHAKLHSFQIAQRRLAAVAVGMKLDRNIAGGFQDNRDQGARALRAEQPADIFETNPPGIGRRGFGRLSAHNIRRVWRGETE